MPTSDVEVETLLALAGVPEGASVYEVTWDDNGLTIDWEHDTPTTRHRAADDMEDIAGMCTATLEHLAIAQIDSAKALVRDIRDIAEEYDDD